MSAGHLAFELKLLGRFGSGELPAARGPPPPGPSREKKGLCVRRGLRAPRSSALGRGRRGRGALPPSPRPAAGPETSGGDRGPRAAEEEGEEEEEGEKGRKGMLRRGDQGAGRGRAAHPAGTPRTPAA